MWLAETAADTDSLELLAQQGINFTLLRASFSASASAPSAITNSSPPIPQTPPDQNQQP